MSRIREMLEEIKALDDERREAEGDPPEDAMILYPPATTSAAKKLLRSGWSHPLPDSYGAFLAATDGVTKFRGRLDFLGTDSTRQQSIRTVIDEKVEQDKLDLRALFKKVDDAVIEKWESDPENFYVANHAVIAVTEMGGLLFYDSRTRDASGEMELCWRSATEATIEARYENIEKFLEASLSEAREESGV